MYNRKEREVIQWYERRKTSSGMRVEVERRHPVYDSGEWLVSLLNGYSIPKPSFQKNITIEGRNLIVKVLFVFMVYQPF